MLGYRGSRIDIASTARPTIELKRHVGSGVLPANTRPPQSKLTAPVPAGPKPVLDDSGVLVRSKPAAAPQTNPNPNPALVKINARPARGDQEVGRQGFEAARAQDGVARIRSRTDREIMALARESHRADKQTLADAAKRGQNLRLNADSLLNHNMTTATRKVMAKRIDPKKARHFKSGIIGYVGEQPVFGSAKHGSASSSTATPGSLYR